MAKRGFSGARQKHTAHVLATLGPKSLFELLDIVGGDKRTVDRSLASLEEQGLVEAVDGTGSPAPGRPSRLWRITTAGREALGPTIAVGLLRASDLWLIATFPGAEAPRIDDALAAGDFLAGVAWVARLDGDIRTYLFVLDPANGEQPVENLFRALSALGARCARGSARPPQEPGEFIDMVTTAARAAAKASET